MFAVIYSVAITVFSIRVLTSLFLCGKMSRFVHMLVNIQLQHF